MGKWGRVEGKWREGMVGRRQTKQSLLHHVKKWSFPLPRFGGMLDVVFESKADELMSSSVLILPSFRPLRRARNRFSILFTSKIFENLYFVSYFPSIFFVYHATVKPSVNFGLQTILRFDLWEMEWEYFDKYVGKWKVSKNFPVKVDKFS